MKLLRMLEVARRVRARIETPAGSGRCRRRSVARRVRAAFAEMSWLSENGEMSAEPPSYIQFAPPRRLRSQTDHIMP